MNTNFNKLQNIWRIYQSGTESSIMGVIPLLEAQDIRLRQNDGKLKQINITKPTSVESSFIVGLRYIKRDNTYTEDYYSCSRNNDKITTYHKNKLEKKLPEYKGSNKTQIDLNANSNNLFKPVQY